MAAILDPQTLPSSNRPISKRPGETGKCLLLLSAKLIIGWMSHVLADLVEKIPTRVYSSSTQVDRAVAAEIASIIRTKAAAGQQVVLGLATGSTPTGVYDELVRLHKEEGLCFANVITFNLDEYYPMQPRDL